MSTTPGIRVQLQCIYSLQRFRGAARSLTPGRLDAVLLFHRLLSLSGGDGQVAEAIYFYRLLLSDRHRRELVNITKEPGTTPLIA